MSRMGASRRRFLESTIVGSLATTFWSGRAAGYPALAGGPYIDVHTHIGRTWTGDPPMTDEALVRWMDEHDVAKAVVLPLVSPESSSYLNTTEQALAAGLRFPDRLIPFCCLDPRTSYTGGKPGLRSMLKDWVDQGAKGFGELKAGLPIDHPLMFDLYAACGELDLPVLFHTDTLRGMDAPGLPGLERALRAHPKVNFIGHGPGFWASISGELEAKDLGGYPAGRVRPGGALDRLFGAYQNLWGDLSAGSGAGAFSRDPEFGRAFLIRHADHLLFGTDYLKPGQAVPQFALMEKMRLPEAVGARIARENAAKLLRLPS